MRVAELKALARERGLRGNSQMRKPKIIKLTRNNQQSWALDIPPWPNQTQSDRFRHDRPRQPQWTVERCATPERSASTSTSRPAQQEMDIFEQQEMSKS